jgi:hypothetical protein
MGWTKSLFKDFGDQVLMLVLALGIIVFLFAAFSIADDYHVNKVWVFASWNSIALVPLFIKKFRIYLKNLKFIVFLIAWMIFHGLFMVLLMRFLPMAYWPVPILLELGAGGVAANWLFGVVPSEDSVDEWRLTRTGSTSKKNAGGETEAKDK